MASNKLTPQERLRKANDSVRMKVHFEETVTVLLEGGEESVIRAKDFDPDVHSVPKESGSKARAKPKPKKPKEPRPEAVGTSGGYTKADLAIMPVDEIKQLPAFKKVSNPGDLRTKDEIIDALLSV